MKKYHPYLRSTLSTFSSWILKVLVYNEKIIICGLKIQSITHEPGLIFLIQVFEQ